jgi:hypothetical protein
MGAMPPLFPLMWSSTILDLARLAVMGIMRLAKVGEIEIWSSCPTSMGPSDGSRDFDWRGGGGPYKVHLINTKSIVQGGVKIMPFRYCERYGWARVDGDVLLFNDTLQV